MVSLHVRPIPLRVLALALELLPLCVFLLLDGSDGPDGTTFGVFLALLTGFGWLMLSRWDVGVAIGVARGVVLGFALAILSLPLLAVAGCEGCDPLLGIVLVSVLVALYILTTLASAAMLAWHAWRVPSWINRANE